MRVLVLLLLCVCQMQCAKILGYFFVGSISHQVVFQAIWKELSLRGHEVTVVTPDPLNDPSLTNLTEIDISYAYTYFRSLPWHTYTKNHHSSIKIADLFFEYFSGALEEQFTDPKVKSVLNLDPNSFDLILVEAHAPVLRALGGKFKAPVIAVSSTGVFSYEFDFMGNLENPAVYPDALLGYSYPLSFRERWESAVHSLVSKLKIKFYWMPRFDAQARKHLGENLSYIEDLMSRTSMLFLNINPILNNARPNVPGVVEFYQIHFKKPKPLPKDLQKLLDDASEGVVYFSLGSNVKSANLTLQQRTAIIDALKELPYTVLWKWETDHLPNQPKNVITRKWLPQQDVLGHPNIKVFVTQGGLQSLDEAMANAVPLVGLPFMGDQPGNIRKVVEQGLGLGLDPHTLDSDQLKEAILEVAQTRKYRDRMKEVQFLLKDLPMSNLDKVVWWAEYVIRHKGAKHLRSPTADIPWYQYLLLDVLAATFAVLAVSLYLVFIIIRIVYRFIKPAKPSKKVKKS